MPQNFLKHRYFFIFGFKLVGCSANTITCCCVGAAFLINIVIVEAFIPVLSDSLAFFTKYCIYNATRVTGDSHVHHKWIITWRCLYCILNQPEVTLSEPRAVRFRD